ncbi:hypothetical protein JOQ06_007943 [Pogonophryne albipinna]|uniref:Uncharacterized protein n=1 Tax=Pogonophryne albipinna TaxID=1090488 RepID=A0AAD6F9K9_9TELE|nr:hypothetical protein JOQ06_007943 [Pogonophryne albipinna]
MTVDFIIRQHRDSPPTGRRGALCQSFDTVLAAAEEVNPHPADQRSATEDLTTCQPRLSVEESDSHKVALQHVCEFNMDNLLLIIHHENAATQTKKLKMITWIQAREEKRLIARVNTLEALMAAAHNEIKPLH